MLKLCAKSHSNFVLSLKYIYVYQFQKSVEIRKYVGDLVQVLLCLLSNKDEKAKKIFKKKKRENVSPKNVKC